MIVCLTLEKDCSYMKGEGSLEMFLFVFEERGRQSGIVIIIVMVLNIKYGL